MKYHNITKDDMRNGDGLRVVLWVSGCEHHCPGCHNPITWDINCGLDFTEETKAELFKELDKPHIDGVTFSGGDPLHTANRDVIAMLIDEIRETYPEKTIWLYTGYEYEEISTLPLLQGLDVIVTGKYMSDLRDENYEWAGSTNQKVIRLREEK
ncbi:MAG: anaerobic ribonucleoside-triphosphate reductase activating protein [Lachnospiraceae bacterium]|nr:anaerobic ribonucleoside-triphosphate reductase activating protein [Lachnospiraceae bacterium]